MGVKLDNWKLLLIFIAIFLFLGAGKLYDHKINHDTLTGYLASDAFTHNWVSQNIYDTGHINQPQEYLFDNQEDYEQNKEDYKLYHPTPLPLLTASIAKLTRLNVFDVNTILVFFAIVLMITLIYLILAKFNTLLALFSLPLTLLFLQRKFFISISWGWWDFLFAEFFLLALILLVLNKRFNYRFVLISVLILVAFMAHGVEAIYAAVFITFYLLFNLIFDRKEFMPLFIEQIKAAALVLILGGYAIIIFLKTWSKIGGSQIMLMSNSEFLATHSSNYFIFFTEFISFKFLIVIGLLILVYLLYTKKHKVLSYAAFVIFMSLTPHLYFTAGERGYQWRFLWPIYLSLAFGGICLFAYLGLKKYITKKGILKSLIFAGTLITLLVIVTPMPFMGPGVLHPLEYESYKWVQDNTEIHSDILVMFTPSNSQISRLYLLKRDLFVSRIDTAQRMSLENSKLQLLTDLRLKPIYFFYKKDISLFKESNFQDYIQKEWKNYAYENISVCDFDYIYVPLINQQEINQANAAYISNLVNKNISQIVFNNNGAAVVKNVIQGEECEKRYRR